MKHCIYTKLHQVHKNHQTLQTISVVSKTGIIHDNNFANHAGQIMTKTVIVSKHSF